MSKENFHCDLSQLYGEFNDALLRKDKQGAVDVIIDYLKSGDVCLERLYTDVFSSCLQGIASNHKTQKIPIWEEHFRTQVVRTCVELCYPCAVKQGEAKGLHGSAVSFCLEGEYHELGARIVTDFLISLGVDANFIGANTPRKEALDAVLAFRPNLVCISVTNYYHLHKLRDFIADVKEACLMQGVIPPIFVVGGYGVKYSSQVKDQILADYYIFSLKELKKVKENVL
ncbi:cobalamin-dependent protein [Proteinivorax hydrogeniformans]|uniref:Cobalamin-dependent protein n=1 Tax=Proteinivorax hydrogeniformans TaxID=1826727 RepID=A0AAU8HUC0_9FIRM